MGEHTPLKKCFSNLKKANWEYFKSNLENYPQQINVIDCVEQVEREGLAYVESLYLLMDSVCPHRTALPHKPMGWWNNELKEMRKQVHVLSRRRDKTDLDGQLYKVARNDYNKAVDTARNEGWKTLCTKAESTKSVANIVKILDGKSMKQISLLNNKGALTTAPQQSLECMMSTHFINSSSVMDEQFNYTEHSGDEDRAGVH